MIWLQAWLLNLGKRADLDGGRGDMVVAVEHESSKTWRRKLSPSKAECLARELAAAYSQEAAPNAAQFKQLNS